MKHHTARSQEKTVPAWREIGLSIFLATVTWIVFGQTVIHDFVNYDDKTYVYGNSLVSGGLTPASLVKAFGDIQTGNWHPLTMISHMIDASLYGLKAGGHHFTNVFLHAVAVVLLFFVLRSMTAGPSETENVWRSAFVAVIFAIHPLRVESVAWIAERKDVLSGVFFMLTLAGYLYYVRVPSLRRYAGMFVLFGCGLMAKPMLVTIPGLLLLLDYWPLGRSQPPARKGAAGQARAQWRGQGSEVQTWTRLILEKVPLLALSAGASAITFVLQEHRPGSIAQLPLMWRVENAAVSYLIYIRQMVWPIDLTAFYPHPENRLPAWQALAAATLVIAITIVAFILRKTRPYLLVGWGWYILMLVPVIGIVEVGLQGHADRYTYLPQIGLYIAITWLVADLTLSLPYRRKILTTAAILTVLALGACAWKQTSYWRNSETLWQRALAVTEDNDVAHTNLGMLLTDRGQLDEALSHFQEALDIRSRSAKAAGSHYDLSLALIYGDVGNVLARKGQLDLAIVNLRKAVEFQPDYADAHYNLGTALFQRGDLDEAISEWQKTLALRPSDAGAHTSLGNGFVQKKLLAQAAEQYRLAIQISPDSVIPLNNLAWLLATTPDPSLRNGPEAVTLAEKANQYSGNTNPLFIRTLAAAYAKAGCFDGALNTALQASELARAQGQRALSNQIQEEMELYRRRLPLPDESLGDAR